ncbi:NO-inducible flavohemoprotein [Heyndrickxia ginsengihumi]|uniref:NO-inducible flavohemoprotein n=1 Tax=Heyndrickxia ginsengihumi TaxID=363870 RepID=UPI00203E1502|nr:NO-inducible flavohemoprotein [Heyndrickxia ginsengihumi]MCM3024840.1 NO-inducible flavohemoprotein [Heyndrickxia ginsengihumi]
MLSQKTIDIVKSTVPVLEEHGTKITSYFYKTMFAAHPELLNIFNHVNQAQGRQQTALANTVIAAAKYIDRLEAILPVVDQIAHKHRGLGIKADQYPIVGKYLLLAIKHVLGDAATDEIINAWAEAYGAIADVFIAIEKEMYKEAASQPGGWDDFKAFTIIKKVHESNVITSFYLKPVDGKPVPTYQPGQYITIRVKIPGEEYILNRQYSLSNAPGNEYFRISVKREADNEPNGKVSVYLHDHVQEGDQIEVSAPAGVFTLNMEEDAPIALISGGVGLTPMMTMLESLVNVDSKRDVTFIHSARNEEYHAFKEEQMKLCSQLENGHYYFGYEKPLDPNGDYAYTGYLNKEFLEKVIDSNTICYVCGPVPFLKGVVTSLAALGIPEENIRYEFFGPSMQLMPEAVNN